MAEIHRFSLRELQRVVAEAEKLQREWGRENEIVVEFYDLNRNWFIAGEKEGQVVELH